MALMEWTVVHLPVAQGWTGQAAYERVFGSGWRIILASMAAFFVGDFLNSVVLAKMKIWTKGKHLWTRTIGSTIVGEGADSLIFYPLAFYGMADWPVSTLGAVMLSQFILKVSWEVLLTPVTYAVVGWLKRKEGVDVYDVGTDFTPFTRRRLEVQAFTRSPASPSNRRRPSVPPCAGSTTRSGCGIRPSTLPASLRMPGDVARRAVDTRRDSGRRRGLRPRAGRASLRRPGNCRRGGRPGRGSPRRVILRGEQALAVLDRSGTWRQTKLSPALRISAPGRSPASVSTWKPLQMPITGTPRAAASLTARMTGERAAIAPERR